MGGRKASEVVELQQGYDKLLLLARETRRKGIHMRMASKSADGSKLVSEARLGGRYKESNAPHALTGTFFLSRTLSSSITKALSMGCIARSAAPPAPSPSEDRSRERKICRP
jgi:hypothetical protein